MSAEHLLNCIRNAPYATADLGIDPDDNTLRADRAEAVLLAYEKLTQHTAGNESVSTLLGDLLVDLRHLAGRHLVAFEQLVESSAEMQVWEIAEAAPDRKLRLRPAAGENEK